MRSGSSRARSEVAPVARRWRRPRACSAPAFHFICCRRHLCGGCKLCPCAAHSGPSDTAAGLTTGWNGNQCSVHTCVPHSSSSGRMNFHEQGGCSGGRTKAALAPASRPSGAGAYGSPASPLAVHTRFCVVWGLTGGRAVNKPKSFAPAMRGLAEGVQGAAGAWALKFCC